MGTLFTGIIDRKPVTDPHVMFMGIGDVEYDSAPLQVSQFEADNRIAAAADQPLAGAWRWRQQPRIVPSAVVLRGRHTVHDAMQNRGKRGYLFTVGDEEVPTDLLPEHIQSVLGYKPQHKWTAQARLQEAQRQYNVFHIVVKQGQSRPSVPWRCDGWLASTCSASTLSR